MLRVGIDSRDDLMLRRERLGGVMREVGAQEAQSPRLSRNREGASTFEHFGAVTVCEIEYAEERARRQHPALVFYCSGEDRAGWAEMSDPFDQIQDSRRRLFREVSLDDAALTFAGNGVFAQELVGSGIDDAYPQSTDVNDDFGADVVRRSMVVGPVDLDETIEVNGALTNSIVFKARRR